MPALEGKSLSLYIYSGHRLRLFIDCLGKLLGQRCYFRSTPKLTLMASCTSVRVHLYDFQFFLLMKQILCFFNLTPLWFTLNE
jgi:hypothetical protein